MKGSGKSYRGAGTKIRWHAEKCNSGLGRRFQVPDNRREQDDGRIGEEVALLINPCFIEVQKRDVGAFVGIRDIVHKAGVDGIAAVRAAGIVEVDDAELRLDGVFVQMPEQVVVGNACKVVEFIVVDEHRETLLDMLFDIVVQYGVAFPEPGRPRTAVDL